ncbi:unnamed protein product [Enterobius vermicularis]|uniref:Transposase n=1 Tax=Enterobius vermicularis TaxID=51028 RepID=A0A0N4V7I9_ENTVE|nr:unnamed protein product [Enterobius vermicularis]
MRVCRDSSNSSETKLGVDMTPGRLSCICDAHSEKILLPSKCSVNEQQNCLFMVLYRIMRMVQETPKRLYRNRIQQKKNKLELQIYPPSLIVLEQLVVSFLLSMKWFWNGNPGWMENPRELRNYIRLLQDHLGMGILRTRKPPGNHKRTKRHVWKVGSVPAEMLSGLERI